MKNLETAYFRDLQHLDCLWEKVTNKQIFFLLINAIESLFAEDIYVAELMATKQVIKNNILSTVAETKSILEDLKNDEVNSNNLGERSETLNLARIQLQKLLDITLST